MDELESLLENLNVESLAASKSKSIAVRQALQNNLATPFDFTEDNSHEQTVEPGDGVRRTK